MILSRAPQDLIALIFGATAAALVWRYGFNFWSFGLPSLCLIGFIADGIVRPSARWFLPVITHGARDSAVVALTFDDGPDPQVTPQILDLLKAHGAKATFFVIGRHVEQHPDLARRIVAEGHELGNHTDGHSRLFNFWLAPAMHREIERASERIRRIAGVTPRWFRPPVGLKNPQLILATRPLALDVVLWSLHARDTLQADSARIAARVLARIRAGDIVDLHDGHDAPGQHRPQTIIAVGHILAGLQARGLRAVTLSALRGD